MAIDRRVERTRNALYDALVGLIRDRGYSAIGVAEIVEAANVGRSTFYAHFHSKDELLVRSLERLRPVLQAGRERQLREPLTGSCHGTLALFHHVAEYGDVLAALEGTPAKAAVLEAIGAELTRFLGAHAAARREPFGPSRDLVLRYIVGAFTSVLSWWLAQHPRPPAEQADRLFHELVGNGIPPEFFGASGPIRSRAVRRLQQPAL